MGLRKSRHRGQQDVVMVHRPNSIIMNIHLPYIRGIPLRLSPEDLLTAATRVHIGVQVQDEAQITWPNSRHQ